MKEKKKLSKARRVFDLVLLIAIAVLWVKFSAVYPELRVPKWGDYTTSAPEEAPETGSKYKFYYDRLSNEEKYAYKFIMDEIYSFPVKIEVPTLESEGLSAVFEAILLDNPDMFFLSKKGETSQKLGRLFFYPQYNITKEEYAQMKSEVDEKCREILLAINLNGTAYSIEKGIHDYIVTHCEYTYTEGDYISSSVYGCLINGLASCEGYSKAMSYLLEKVNIENTMVNGFAKNNQGYEAAHMWNIVKTDGTYKYIDVTWDDPVSNTSGRIYYDYFNVGKDKISKTHYGMTLDIVD